MSNTGPKTGAKARKLLACAECGMQAAQWSGRCAGCGAWGSVGEVVPARRGREGSSQAGPLEQEPGSIPDRRVSTGLSGLDRVLGGGLVPASVALLAGEPGIGKSTLLLHVVAALAASGHPCLLVSGEESGGQVAARARRLGLDPEGIRFAPGRDLASVLETAAAEHPFLLAVDSIQALRDTAGSQLPGGPAQVRLCADALVGLAKSEQIAVLMTGHVTKDGDLAGPRTLEHAVDVVLGFDGDARSGLRTVSGGKNRFGAEGETAWFEMGAAGLSEIDPSRLLVGGGREPGAATALPQAGRRALAVEVQALVGPTDGPARRQTTGLDPRRFQLVAAVVDRALGLGLSRAELFGASSGGVRIDDPACDLAVAAALVSAATGVPPPAGAAFLGEVSLTGMLRPAPAMAARLAAARAVGVSTVFAPPASAGQGGDAGPHQVAVTHIREAFGWVRGGVENPRSIRSA
jgi:DNA repair protein RadA/Sms